MTTNSDETGPELDLDVLLANAEAEVGETAEPEADDGGPEESGELPEDDAPPAADEESDEIDDDDLDALDDADEEDDDDDLEPEDDESGEDDDADEDDPEDEADPRLLALEKKLEIQAQEAEALRLQNQQLMEFVRQGAVPRQQPQEQRDPVFESAWLAAHLGDEEAFEKHAPEVQRRVTDLARKLGEARAQWALHPEEEYRIRFEPLVQSAIQEAIRPFLAEREQRELDSVLDPHRDFIEQHRELVIANLPPTYGAPNPDDPRVAQQRLETAVALAKAKLAEGEVRKREQRVKTKDRQQDAKRRSRKRGSRSKPRKGQAKAPRIAGVDGDSLSDFANRLAADPALLEQAERELRR